MRKTSIIALSLILFVLFLGAGGFGLTGGFGGGLVGRFIGLFGAAVGLAAALFTAIPSVAIGLPCFTAPLIIVMLIIFGIFLLVKAI